MLNPWDHDNTTPFFHVRRHFFPPHFALGFVGQEEMNPVGVFDGFDVVGDQIFAQRPAVFDRQVETPSAGPNRHHHVHSGIFEVQGLGMPLGPVSQHNNFFAFQDVEIRVLVVIGFRLQFNGSAARGHKRSFN
jgi:hypothetical protein